MITRIFTSRTQPRIGRRAPRAPDGMRIYAIGDIHGRADKLEELGALIEADMAERSAGEETVLVFLGDYIDRGPDSRAVIDMLVDGPALPARTVFLKGNHEAMLLAFLDDPSYGLAWRDYGGRDTMASYGLGSAMTKLKAITDGRATEALAAALPKSHHAFFQSLELSVVFGDYAFVHAGIRPDTPLDAQKENDLMWIRAPFLDWNRDLEHVVVHGHTPSESPQVRRHRIGIDTGACDTGVLTAVCLEGDRHRFLQTSPDA